MRIRIHETMQVGDLIAAAYDEAARQTSDPRDVSRVATQVVSQFLESARRALPPPLPTRALEHTKLEAERHPVKLVPLYDRVLATRVAETGKTAGGLYIPDTAKEKPLEALVVSVGSGKVLENGQVQPLSVKAGDTVLIGKYSGSEVKLDGKDHIILREDDILAIIESRS
jgi:chaperonin GroES